MAGTFGSYVVMDPSKLAAFFRSPEGPVMRQMIERAELVKQQAILECPVSTDDSGFRKRAPGTLQRSIVKRIIMTDKGPTAQVGSEDPVALWVHEGTVPHIITPVRAAFLVFRVGRRFRAGGRGGGGTWTKGNLVFTKMVHHPGTKPNRFLLRALRVLRH